MSGEAPGANDADGRTIAVAALMLGDCGDHLGHSDSLGWGRLLGLAPAGPLSDPPSAGTTLEMFTRGAC